jgi:hypothetical protein
MSELRTNTEENVTDPNFKPQILSHLPDVERHKALLDTIKTQEDDLELMQKEGETDRAKIERTKGFIDYCKEQLSEVSSRIAMLPRRPSDEAIEWSGVGSNSETATDSGSSAYISPASTPAATLTPKQLPVDFKPSEDVEGLNKDKVAGESSPESMVSRASYSPTHSSVDALNK